MTNTFRSFLILIGFVFLFNQHSQSATFHLAAHQSEATLSPADSLSVSQLKGYPVYGYEGDTLFLIFSRSGSLTPKDRAGRISSRIQVLAENDLYRSDSLKVEELEGTYDILYEDQIILSITSQDAKIHKIGLDSLATEWREVINSDLLHYQDENRLEAWAMRVGLTLAAILTAIGIFFFVQKGSQKLIEWVTHRRERLFKNLAYRSYTYLTQEQELAMVLQLIRFFKWFVILVILYLLLPVLFSIFPMSRDWSEAILELVMRPIRNVLHSTWNYLPNLFSILVIVIFMRYLIRFIRFVFKEIEAEKLEINGFHADWAMPTYNIVRFLLFAFTLVLIFPYLPGSDSPIFKGVTVFAIPNASVLNGNTVNYSLQAEREGLILHTTITLGYDLPWRKVHQTLIDAALATDLLEKEPKPYVLQTSLDDFYVSYQLNAYTKQASKQALAYSELHKNIQDFCRDRDIEIMSPHYRANRDGSDITIPKHELDQGKSD